MHSRQPDRTYISQRSARNDRTYWTVDEFRTRQRVGQFSLIASEGVSLKFGHGGIAVARRHQLGNDSGKCQVNAKRAIWQTSSFLERNAAFTERVRLCQRKPGEVAAMPRVVPLGKQSGFSVLIAVPVHLANSSQVRSSPHTPQ